MSNEIIKELCDRNTATLGFTVILIIVTVTWFIHSLFQIKSVIRKPINWYKVWEDTKAIFLVVLVLAVGMGSLLGCAWLIGWLIKLIICG